MPYHVDLSRLTYDLREGVVTITLPAVTLGDIALHPERAATINDGVPIA